MHSQLHWLHLEKRICESSAFLQKCICSYTGCICKKTSKCQWSLASQEKSIGFVGFGLCFDLLGPKFLIRARRLKKGARGGVVKRNQCSFKEALLLGWLFRLVGGVAIGVNWE